MKWYFSMQTGLFLIALLAVVAGIGAAVYAYTGPNRTRTEAIIVCKIVLWECQEVPDKGDYRYHQVDDWFCSNESKPWLDKPSQPPPSGCYKEVAGSSNQYWTREESVEDITVTYPPAEISAQPLCSLPGQNGWCRGGAGLQLSGYEPVAGEQITGLEGTLNGETFAVQNSASAVIPALEGQSDFQYWAHSSFADTSLMGTTSLLLDTQAPIVTDSALSGSPGKNGWYISPVAISVSFSDPVPGSGLAAPVYSLNAGAVLPFVSPLSLNDGSYDVLIQAADIAGNVNEIGQTVLVDTVAPQLQNDLAGTLFDGWYGQSAQLSASANDPSPASGIELLDVSLDGGPWTAYTGPLTIGDGEHLAVFRATDVAGNVTVSTPLSFRVDAKGPKIDLPGRWNVWDTAAFVVRDGGCGLGSVEVIISDPQGRWPKVTRTYTPNGSRYEGEIGWNRRFPSTSLGTGSDDTLAPAGEYRVTVKASDLAGNFSQVEATLVIPSVEDNPGEGAIIQPLVEAEDPPLETTFALPLEEPQPAPKSVESVFGGTSLAALNEERRSETPATSLPGSENILWGAGALAIMAAMTAYYEQKRREEEEAQRAAVHAQFAADQAEKERQQKSQAKVMSKLEKQWAEERRKEQAYQQWKEEQEQQSASHRGQDAKLERDEATEESAWEAWKDRSQLLAAQRAEAERQRQAQEDANRAYAALREKGQFIIVTAPKEKPWWEQAWDAVTTAFQNATAPASVWLGDAPNHEGIKIAEQIVPNEGTITIMAGYGPIVVENFLVRPGISIQAQWYNETIDSRDGWSKDGGLGYAQVSDKQVKGEILDAEGKYTGNLGLGPNFDQTTDKGAYVAMATRIGIALEACAKYCNPAKSQEYNVALNRSIVAGLAQNGPGYSPETFLPKNLPIENSDIDWKTFLKTKHETSAPEAHLRIWASGKPYEPDLMLEMYVQDLRQMHANGMPVLDETLKSLDKILEILEGAKNNE